MTASAGRQAPGDDVYRTHGGGHDARDGVLDLSVNVSPLSPAHVVRAAIAGARLDRYPDPEARDARRAVAARFGVDMSQVLVGHGAAELLWLTCQALVGSSDRALVWEPTFSEWPAAARACGADVQRLSALERDDFAMSTDALRTALARCSPQLAYLCSPNNPSGARAPIHELFAVARAYPATCFVLDQAFVALGDHPEELEVLPPPNVICVRSLTKEQALPGLRVGYLLAEPGLVERLERRRPAWHTSAPAQAAIAAAMVAGDHVARVRARMLGDRARLEAALQRAGLRPLPSSAPFVLVRVGDGAAFARAMRAADVLVRDATSFGLPAHVRIAGVPAADLARFEHALAAAVPHTPGRARAPAAGSPRGRGRSGPSRATPGAAGKAAT